MNNQDALNELRAICKYCGGKDKDCSIDKPYLFGGACEFHFAAKALEKQIPKKPIKDPINDFIIDGVMCEAWRNVCPICHHIIARPCDYDFGSVGNKCCGGCGQAIDWSENE